MAVSHHGLDGAIGPPKTADYSGKAIVPPGTKPYTKTFARLSITGGIIKHARSYAGKVELEPLVQGGVQSQAPILNGFINRTAFRDISGGVLASPPVLVGDVNPLARDISGGVASPAPVISGAVNAYPLAGWSLTDFTVEHSGLDPDSPFTDPIYSDITAVPPADKCHYENLTPEDGLTIEMDGLGQFTVTAGTITQPNTFDVQIYDASDGTFGSISTITVHQPDAQHNIGGGVQAQAPVLSGSLNRFTVHDIIGGVQCGLPTLFGIVTKGDTRIIVGGVQAAAPVLVGTIEDISKVSGGVQAAAPVLSGAIEKVSRITGGVIAQPPVLYGDLSPPKEEPGTTDPRSIKRKFINRKIKWKSNQRRLG